MKTIILFVLLITTNVFFAQAHRKTAIVKKVDREMIEARQFENKMKELLLKDSLERVNERKMNIVKIELEKNGFKPQNGKVLISGFEVGVHSFMDDEDVSLKLKNIKGNIVKLNSLNTEILKHKKLLDYYNRAALKGRRYSDTEIKEIVSSSKKVNELAGELQKVLLDKYSYYFDMSYYGTKRSEEVSNIILVSNYFMSYIF